MIYALVIYILTPFMVTKGSPPQEIVISNLYESEDSCGAAGKELKVVWEKTGSQAWPICYPGPDTRTPQEKESQRLIKHPLKHPSNIGDLPDPVKIGQSTGTVKQ